MSYETTREWGLRFGRLLASTLKRRRPKPGDNWFSEEVFIRIRGKLHHLWRAVHQAGHVPDVWVQSHCNTIPQRSPGGMSAKLTGAAKRFKPPRHAPRFLSAHSRIDNHFQLRRHRLSAREHRAARDAASHTWRGVVGVAFAE